MVGAAPPGYRVKYDASAKKTSRQNSQNDAKVIEYTYRVCTPTPILFGCSLFPNADALTRGESPPIAIPGPLPVPDSFPSASYGMCGQVNCHTYVALFVGWRELLQAEKQLADLRGPVNFGQTIIAASGIKHFGWLFRANRGYGDSKCGRTADAALAKPISDVAKNQEVDRAN